MKVLVIGGTGTIGSAVADALAEEHEVVRVGHSSGEERVDMSDPASIQALYERVAADGGPDAVVSCAGDGAFGGLDELSDDDFRRSLRSKLMGQVNLVRYGLDHVADRGSFTLVSGVLAQEPSEGSAAISLVNAGVEGFTRAAALEAPRGIRVNVVSPGWVSETLEEMGRDPSEGTPAAVVAQTFVNAVEGGMNGRVLPVPDPSVEG